MNKEIILKYLAKTSDLFITENVRLEPLHLFKMKDAKENIIEMM